MPYVSTTTTILDPAEWADRCSHAAFAAIAGRKPERFLKFGADLLSELQDAECYWEPMWPAFEGTVAQFCASHPTGAWVIITKGHAMALVDNVLTDTMAKGADRRKVQDAYRIVW